MNEYYSLTLFLNLFFNTAVASDYYDITYILLYYYKQLEPTRFSSFPVGKRENSVAHSVYM